MRKSLSPSGIKNTYSNTLQVMLQQLISSLKSVVNFQKMLRPSFRETLLLEKKLLNMLSSK